MVVQLVFPRELLVATRALQWLQLARVPHLVLLEPVQTRESCIAVRKRASEDFIVRLAITGNGAVRTLRDKLSGQRAVYLA